MTESVEPIELVLEFLAAKGFVNAEAALREQLELERTPLPVTEQGFSQLEAMLIRSATAGPAKSTGSILQEMRPPVLKAIVADEDMPQSPDTHAAAAAYEWCTERECGHVIAQHDALQAGGRGRGDVGDDASVQARSISLDAARPRRRARPHNRPRPGRRQAHC